MVINVISSGLNPTGILAGSSDLLNADANDIANQLASMGALANFSGIEVHFYGLGQASGEQVIPAPSRQSSKPPIHSALKRRAAVRLVEPERAHAP